MKKITQYIPFHLSIFLTLGIIVGYYSTLSKQLVFSSIVISFIALGLIFFVNNQTKLYNIIFKSALYFLVFSLGVGNVFIHNPTENKLHYSHFIKDENLISFQLSKKLKSNPYHTKYYANVIQLNKNQTQGKILLNIKKDSLPNSFEIGAVYMAKSNFKNINKALNPYIFNYGEYLKKNEILHQITLSNKQLLKIDISVFSTQSKAARWRLKIEKSLAKYPFSKNEIGIIKALVLGQRQEISKELLNQYAGAGAIHILAVSGLHIGILFLLLNFVLKPVEYFFKGNYIKTILIVLFLWGFALLTGMSASVVRAVTMFTFIAFGMLSKNRKSPVLHALFASYLFLLLIHPMFLFDVGFQMSYTAVLGIVLLQPKFIKLVPKTKFWLLNKIGLLLSVSIAATIGTLPISLYYFHQFPGLFFVSNVIIIPFIGLIMGVGILVVFLAILQQLPIFIVEIYALIIRVMNTFISWVAHQEAFIFKNISFSIFMLLASYLVILTAYRWWETQEIKKQLSFLVAIVILFSVLIFEKYQVNIKNELVVFHKNKESVIGVKYGENQLYFHTLDSLEIKNNYFLKAYEIKTKNTQKQYGASFPNYLKYGGASMLILDSTSVYKNLKMQVDIVYLRQSPRINLNRLLQKINPKTILVDGSNYRSYVESWRRICKDNNVKFHYTGTDAAFVFK